MPPRPGPDRLLLRERVADDDLALLNEGNPLAWSCGMWEDLDRTRGTALREVSEELCRGVVPGLELMYVEHDPAATATLAAWGLEPGPRHHESVLDLTLV